MLLAFILPFASLIAVAAVAIALGAVFTQAGNTGTSFIGLGIIVAVPAIGFLLTRGSNDSSPESGESEGSSH